ncbi:hypothetical protein RUM44_006934 [Polyplax serrata]|uniref:DUF1279 domain-containing protein n=1 Tax=Polyplax serrata TaxID=468196 RepID=A0ABR1AZS3_POLSC
MLMQMQSIVAKDNNILMCCPLRWSSLKTMKCSGVTCMRSQFFNTRPPTGNDQVPQEKKLSMFQKIKKMWKEYWYVVFPVHLVTSAVWAGGFYYLVQSGIDIPALLLSLGAPESWVEKLKASNAGNIVLTYTLYKLVTPLRYAVTIGGTTYAINVLRKIGWMPPPLKNPLCKYTGNNTAALSTLKARSQDKMQVIKHVII